MPKSTGSLLNGRDQYLRAWPVGQVPWCWRMAGTFDLVLTICGFVAKKRTVEYILTPAVVFTITVNSPSYYP